MSVAADLAPIPHPSPSPITAPPSPAHLTPSSSSSSPSPTPQPHHLPPFYSDTLAGFSGGLVSVLLGQPFDLIRVRLQTANSSDVIGTTRKIWIHESPKAFYKGATMPFLGSGVSVAVQFAVFHRVRMLFEARNVARGFEGVKAVGGNGLTLGQNYLSGVAAGVANSVITGPTEHIRTRMQLQPHGAAALYKGSWDCVRQIVRKRGFWGLYKNYPVAIAKEAQAFGCYFASFELSMYWLGRVTGRKRGEIRTWELVPCGALGGIGFWVGSYPIDVVKNKLQNDGWGKEARYRNVWAAVAETWSRGGMMGFWRGLSPTLVRTSLSSAGCFTV